MTLMRVASAEAVAAVKRIAGEPALPKFVVAMFVVVMTHSALVSIKAGADRSDTRYSHDISKSQDISHSGLPNGASVPAFLRRAGRGRYAPPAIDPSPAATGEAQSCQSKPESFVQGLGIRGGVPPRPSPESYSRIR